MPSVAEVLLGGLKNAGAARLFGVPGGGSSLELLEAARRCGLPFVLCHQETAACIMAAVTGELTGKPGGALVALGPGAASAVNGVAYARLDRAPLVVFTDRHPEGTRAFTTHQALDHRGLLGTVAKASMIVGATAARAQIVEAVELALTDPRGPVHLELPADVASEPAGGSAPVEEPEPEPPTETSGMNRAAEQIRSSRRPVLLVGLQCRDDEDTRYVRELATRLGAPILTTYKAKGIVPDDHPLHAGIFTGAAIEQSVVGAADLIVAVGLDHVELIPKRWAYKSPVVHISREPSSAHYYRPDVALTGRPGQILQELMARLGPDVLTEWKRETLAELKRSVVERLVVPTEGLAPHRVVQMSRKIAPAASIAVVDSGAHMFPLTHFWTARAPQSFLISNGLATMGFALPAAIAAQLARPELPVICFTGDGGLMMVAAELETVKRLSLPIVIVVFNDRALSLIQVKQQQKGYGDRDMSYCGPDFPTLARSFGFEAFAAVTETEFKEAFAAALATEGPALVDARVDPSGYRPMLEAIRGAPSAKAGSGLSGQGRIDSSNPGERAR